MISLATLFAYWGWYGGWWWWWIIIVIFFWLIFIPPFGYGSRWYYGSRYGSGMGVTPMSGSAQWDTIAARFVEQPAAALQEADRVVSALMQRRNAAPSPEYRAARDILEKSERSSATIDEMRQAMLVYRSVFDRLA